MEWNWWEMGWVMEGGEKGRKELEPRCAGDGEFLSETEGGSERLRQDGRYEFGKPPLGTDIRDGQGTRHDLWDFLTEIIMAGVGRGRG